MAVIPDTKGMRTSSDQKSGGVLSHSLQAAVVQTSSKASNIHFLLNNNLVVTICVN